VANWYTYFPPFWVLRVTKNLADCLTVGRQKGIKSFSTKRRHNKINSFDRKSDAGGFTLENKLTENILTENKLTENILTEKKLTENILTEKLGGFYETRVYGGNVMDNSLSFYY
jgi:hypothetical protein